MRRILVALLAAAALAAAVGSALAARAPTRVEGVGLRTAVAGFIRVPGSPAAHDNRIASIAVSRVDPRYARVRLLSRSAGASEMVLHRSRGVWYVGAFGSFLGCEAAPRAVLVDLRVPCSPPAGRAWVSNCGPLMSAPRNLTLACADANFALADLGWRGWGAGRATARGIARVNDCTPNCAAGRMRSYRVTAIADRLRRCGSARYYARVTVVFAGSRPTGGPRREVWPLGC